MQEFYGTKRLLARPMTKIEYNTYRGWDTPEDEDPTEEGYLVEYLDSPKQVHKDHKYYISWSPKDVFEAAYKPTTAMAFGHAVEAMKLGYKVARHGWNGKSMFLYMVPSNRYPVERNSFAQLAGIFENDLVPYRSYIAMFTAQNDVVPWVASQSDILENDWYIVKQDG